jgi:hypothetical protein
MQQMVEEEFEKEYVNDGDPSILHFFLVAGENVRSDHPWALCSLIWRSCFDFQLFISPWISL